MTDDELLEEIARLKSVMIAVATGGPQIDTVNNDYIERWRRVDTELRGRHLTNPNPHRDLWDWYGRYGDGLSRYVDRRTHIREMYLDLEDQIRQGGERRHDDEVEPTGWERVDRQLDRMRGQLRDARSPEDFQGVGLLGREVIISLAQSVFDPETDGPLDRALSDTDAKAMLDGYVGRVVPGGGNEELRRAIRAVLQATVALQHDRAADRLKAAVAYELTVATVNSIHKIEELRVR